MQGVRGSAVVRRLGVPAARSEREIRVPGSKSIALRALWLAAAAGRDLRLRNAPAGDDVRHAVGCLRALGHGAEEAEGELRVSAGTDAGETVELAVGESGTAARFATAHAAWCRPPGTRTRVPGAGSLARRRSPALFRALRAAGVFLESRDGGWPVEVVAAEPPRCVRLERPESSQELSAILLALVSRETTVDVVGPVPSQPFVALTQRVARDFGIELTDTGCRSGSEIDRAPVELVVEPDAGLAAVVGCAAVLAEVPLRVPGLEPSSIQGDARVLEHLAAVGARVQTEPGATVFAPGRATPADLDFSGEPDLAPVLAPVLAHVAVTTGRACRASGLETLPGKESDRLAGLVEALERTGFEVAREDPATLVLRPTFRPPHSRVELDPRGDHRMVFAHALLGLKREEVWCRSPEAVAKTWPSFWEDLHAAGFPLEESAS